MQGRSVVSLIIFTLVCCLTTAASAAPRDAAAQKKIKEAINTHYLATEFDKAEALLKGILEACEDRCSPEVKAQDWMYIGIVRGSGKQDIGGAQQAFQQALALDPNVKLDDALATPAVRQAFSDAAAALGQPTPAAGGGVATAGGGGGVSLGASGELPGTMECSPNVSEVETRRPIPVSCTSDEPLARVTLRYKPFGSDEWMTVQMTKKGQSWQGQIPCSDTSITGRLRWYVQGRDSAGDVLDSYGSKTKPAEITLVHSTEEAPPSYPGQAAPVRCMDAAACPEEMVGTPACPVAGGGGGGKTRGTKGWGAPCDTSWDCDVGLLCMQTDTGRTCETAPSCASDSDCPSDAICKNGTCDVSEEAGEGPSGPYKKHWLGVHFALDLAFIGGNDVCSPTGRQNDFVCFDGNGDEYGGTPATGAGGKIGSGAQLGTMRVLLSYEYAVLPNLGIEGRVGFAFNGAPSGFLPVHVEPRLKYWFGSNPLGRKGIRGFLHLGGGLAQVDAKLNVRVQDPGFFGGDGIGTLDAYKRLGQAFASAGGGLMYAFANNHGLVLDLNAMVMFPSTGFVIQPTLGYELGL